MFETERKCCIDLTGQNKIKLREIEIEVNGVDTRIRTINKKLSNS